MFSHHFNIYSSGSVAQIVLKFLKLVAMFFTNLMNHHKVHTILTSIFWSLNSSLLASSIVETTISSRLTTSFPWGLRIKFLAKCCLAVSMLSIVKLLMCPTQGIGVKTFCQQFLHWACPRMIYMLTQCRTTMRAVIRPKVNWLQENILLAFFF